MENLEQEPATAHALVIVVEILTRGVAVVCATVVLATRAICQARLEHSARLSARARTWQSAPELLSLAIAMIKLSFHTGVTLRAW